MSLLPSSGAAKFPFEILCGIVAESDAGTLANWCGVNTTFLAEAGPLLYHTVVINAAEDVMPFIERLRAFRASLPLPGSPDYQLHTFFRAVRYLDILAYPPPELLVALPDVVQPASTATHLELTVGGQADHTREGLAGFWIPRLLLAIRPIVFHSERECWGRMLRTTVPSLHLAVWISTLSDLGPVPSHPDRVPNYSRHTVLHHRIASCLHTNWPYIDGFLRQFDRGMYDLANSSFDVEDFRAWIRVSKSYFALRRDPIVVRWASVEEMASWHQSLEAQWKVYQDEIKAIPHSHDAASLMAQLAALRISSNL